MTEPYIGEIRMFAGIFAPRQWAFCNGQDMPINGNESLFSLLGTAYGGNGRSSFKLPEMRGRLPMHRGTGPGLTARTQGQLLGVEQVELTPEQMPAHDHGLVVSKGVANTSNPIGGLVASQTDGDLPYTAAPTDPAKLQEMDSRSLADSGGSQGHNNMMPYLGINFIIALMGIYPSRN